MTQNTNWAPLLLLFTISGVGCSAGNGAESTAGGEAGEPVSNTENSDPSTGEPMPGAASGGGATVGVATGGSMGTGSSAGGTPSGSGGSEPTPDPFTDGKLRVYLLAGQSNMEGHGLVQDRSDDDPAIPPSLDSLIQSGAEPSSLMEQRDDTYVIYKNRWAGDRSDYLDPRFGPVDEFFGVELSMGHDLGDKFDGPIVFYKTAAGGTPLAVHWRPPSASDHSGIKDDHRPNIGTLYDDMIEGFNAFVANPSSEFSDYDSEDIEVAGFIWLQGFNDQFDGYEAQYEDNLVHLGNDVRAALNEPQLPVIVVDSPIGGSNGAYFKTARENAVARLNETAPGFAVYVDARDLVNDAIPEGYHWNNSAATHLEVGRRTSSAILENGFY